MKKISVFVLSAVAVATLAVSCQGGGSVNTNVSLKNEVDTLSYAFGENVAENGMHQVLQQLGVYADTANFRMGLMQKIAAEPDSLKKEVLKKEMSTRMDSLKRANAKNMDIFLSAVSESLGRPSKDPHEAGTSIGLQLKQFAEGFEANVLDSAQHVDKRIMAAAIVRYLKAEKTLVPNASGVIQMKSMAKQEAAAKKQEEAMKVQFAEKIAKEEAFLEENKSKDGVVVLPSGLQYKILKEGTGEKPTAQSRVKVNYRGTLIDGTEFDSSFKRNEPAEFGVGQVVKGWTEALQLMPVGSKWMLYVPADLGYGGRQVNEILTPFSTLIFEVELLSIEK